MNGHPPRHERTEAVILQSDAAASWRWEVHHGRMVRSPVDRRENVAAMFAEAVARTPDSIAIVEGDERWSYLELARHVGQCAGRLRSLGLQAGDRVGLLLTNRADFVVLLLAAARLGVVSVPMNIRQSTAEIAFALGDCEAGALFAEADVMDKLPQPAAIPSCRHIILVDDGRRAWDSECPPDEQAVAVDEDAACCILYTSGTTGKPKGAVLTHFGIVTNCMGSETALGLRLGESMLLSVPASHVTGLLLVILLAVRVSGKIVIQRQFKAAHFLELAQRERMSFAIMVPAMYNLCLLEPSFPSFDLSSWRVGAFGGAPMPETTIVALAKNIPSLALINIYGATETTSPAVMMPPADLRSRRDKVGKPLPYCDVLIMDEHGRELPPGAIGEIWIAGPVVIPHYLNRPDANSDDFVGGYWKSGDLGMLDDDGYLSLLDRKKDMINRGGFKIYSVEVENVLMGHKAVIEAAVVSRPCSVLGERTEAFVTVSDTVDTSELRALCAELLSDYKVPDHVTVVPGPLPRNANGKLLKTEIRGWAIDLFG